MKKISKEELQEILKLHKEWSYNREKGKCADFSNLDLSNTDLSKVDLSGAIMNDTNLSGANLSSAVFFFAEMFGADLRDTDLSGAKSWDTDFSYANMEGADLTNAFLINSKFISTKLGRANLSGCNLWESIIYRTELNSIIVNKDTKMGMTIIVDTDLSEIENLEVVKHELPSTIGIDTIFKSKGKISKVFLKNAGVPQNFINYMDSLVIKPIDYYSCFISYSSKDEEFAKRLYSDLQQKNIRCWFAPEDMKIGKKIRKEIHESIRLYDKLLLILSKDSVESNWVEDEVESAIAKEKGNKNTVLFPIRIDNNIMESNIGWAETIRNTRHIGDFSNWKNYDDYQKALERLIRDLKLG